MKSREKSHFNPNMDGMEFEFIGFGRSDSFFLGLCARRTAVDETDLSVHIIKAMVMALQMDPFFSI